MWREFELAYYEVVIQYVCHDAMESPFPSDSKKK